MLFLFCFEIKWSFLGISLYLPSETLSWNWELLWPPQYFVKCTRWVNEVPKLSWRNVRHNSMIFNMILKAFGKVFISYHALLSVAYTLGSHHWMHRSIWTVIWNTYVLRVMDVRGWKLFQSVLLLVFLSLPHPVWFWGFCFLKFFNYTSPLPDLETNVMGVSPEQVRWIHVFEVFCFSIHQTSYKEIQNVKTTSTWRVCLMAVTSGRCEHSKLRSTRRWFRFWNFLLAAMI